MTGLGLAACYGARNITQNPRKFTAPGYAIRARGERKAAETAGFGEVPGCLSPTADRLANGNSRS